jgi:hypothetical protein
LLSHTLLFLNDRWFVLAAPRARAPVIIPFEIELLVPRSPAAQGTPVKEQQHQDDHDLNNEYKDDKEYSPLCDTEREKLYMVAEEIESFGAEASVPTGRL